MGTELKVQEGLVVEASGEKFARFIQAPLRARRQRLNLSVEQIVARTGLSSTTVGMYCGDYIRSERHGNCRISTIAKIMDALDYPITESNFNAILSIGGSLLPEAVRNARPQLRLWRESSLNLSENARVGREIVEEAQAESPRAGFADKPGTVMKVMLSQQPQLLQWRDARVDHESGFADKPGAVMSSDQAGRLFNVMLSQCADSVLVEELRRRGSLDDALEAHAVASGWLVVR
jgi:hypothetical protein